MVTFHVSLSIGKDLKERLYTVEVYRKELSYALVKLPILANNVKKATIEVNTRIEITSISRKEQEGLEKFLRTFFSIYPKANTEELKYYGTDLLSIQQPLEFEELSNLQVAKKDDLVEIHCEIVYQDQETRLLFTMHYEISIK